MAINIFQGGTKGSTAKVNSAANSSRAQAAKAALKTNDASVSDSGNTAVKSSGTLGKVGSTVGKIAGIASKFLPGIGGTIAKGISNIFNDPEWWQAIPGDALTANTPLREIAGGDMDFNGIANNLYPAYMNRSAIVEFTGREPFAAGTPSALYYPLALHVTANQVTQYLMPEIRKVVNAIPLQTAQDYKTIVEVNATLYALWRQLKKSDYILKHGTTFISNLNDINAFPVFATENAAWLQATINRLEEYLRSNVRLPHTLCEYEAWRYGRVYRSNDSAKAGLVVYNVIPFSSRIVLYDNLIGYLMGIISSSTSLQQANTDMYNAYFDHDMQVEIRDDTQFAYDKKEFLLRTNLDVGCHYLAYIDPFDQTTQMYSLWMTQGRLQTKPFITDSNLDNPTTFMSSAVSSLCVDDQNHGTVLYPVACMNFYYVQDGRAKFNDSNFPCVAFKTTNGFDRYDSLQTNFCTCVAPSGNPIIGVLADGGAAPYPQTMNEFELLWREAGATYSSLWTITRINSPVLACAMKASDGNTDRMSFGQYLSAIYLAQLTKALDVYNAQVLCCFAVQPMIGADSRNERVGMASSYDSNYGPDDNKKFWFDLTALSIDMGIPSSRTVGIEQVYAFANLIDNARKTSMSYKTAEKMVAKDVANVIDKLDVAAVATK